MPIPEAENVDKVGSYLDYVLGGGATSILILGWVYTKYWLLPKLDTFKSEFLGKFDHAKERRHSLELEIKAINGYIKEDRQTFIELQESLRDDRKQYSEAVSRLDRQESKLEDYVLQIRTEVNTMGARFDDFKNGFDIQEKRVNTLEGQERQNLEEIRKMDSNYQLLERDMSYLKSDMTEIKQTLKALTDMMGRMNETLVRLTARES